MRFSANRKTGTVCSRGYAVALIVREFIYARAVAGLPFHRSPVPPATAVLLFMGKAQKAKSRDAARPFVPLPPCPPHTRDRFLPQGQRPPRARGVLLALIGTGSSVGTRKVGGPSQDLLARNWKYYLNQKQKKKKSSSFRRSRLHLAHPARMLAAISIVLTLGWQAPTSRLATTPAAARSALRAVRAAVDDKAEVEEYFNNEGFSRWNKIYSESDEVNSVQLDIRTGHAETVDKVLGWVDADGTAKAGETFCDAGCGVGSLAIPLAQRGATVRARARTARL